MKDRSAKRMGMCAAVVWVGSGLLGTPAARAQFGEPWVEFEDPLTGQLCGVVNTLNADLTVIEETGEVVLVDGRDEVLPNLFVDEDNNVFLADLPAGSLGFADDADGLPAVFWVTDDGTVVDVDEDTGAPFDSGLLPEEIENTSCDACERIDDDGGFCDPPPDDNDFPITIGCAAGAAPTLLATLLFLPLLGTARRRIRG